MKIGGFQPITASDFPGRMAAIVFTQGCNFRCPFCHNPGLLPCDAESLKAPDEVLSFLYRRKKVLGGVVITGGEPCLQENLGMFCKEVKEMGLALKLDTNGSRPEVIEDLFKRELIDFIAMDIKAPMSKLPELTGGGPHKEETGRSIRLIAESGIDHLFRTTDVKPLLSSTDHREIKQMVPPGSRHIFQPFVAENALSRALRP